MVTLLSYVAAVFFIAAPLVALVVAFIGLVYLSRYGVSVLADMHRAERDAEALHSELSDAEYLSAQPLSLSGDYFADNVVSQVQALIAARRAAQGADEAAEAHMLACLLGFASWGRLRASVAPLTRSAAPTVQAPTVQAPQRRATPPALPAPQQAHTKRAEAPQQAHTKRAEAPQQARFEAAEHKRAEQKAQAERAPQAVAQRSRELALVLAEALAAGDKDKAVRLAGTICELRAHGDVSEALASVCATIGKRGYQARRQVDALRKLAGAE